MPRSSDNTAAKLFECKLRTFALIEWCRVPRIFRLTMEQRASVTERLPELTDEPERLGSGRLAQLVRDTWLPHLRYAPMLRLRPTQPPKPPPRRAALALHPPRKASKTFAVSYSASTRRRTGLRNGAS